MDGMEKVAQRLGAKSEEEQKSPETEETIAEETAEQQTEEVTTGEESSGNETETTETENDDRGDEGDEETTEEGNGGDNEESEENDEKKESKTTFKVKTGQKEKGDKEDNPLSSLDERERLAVVNELTGGAFQSLDDIKNVLSNTQIDDPEVAALYKWKKETGRPLEIYFTTQSKDYAQMSAEDVLVEDMMLKNGLNREDAKLMVEHDYPEDEDATDTEKRIMAIKKERDANKAKKDLLAMQEQFRKPAPQKNKPDPVDEATKEVERFNNDLKGSLSEDNPIVLSVESQGKDIDFELDGDMMAELKNDAGYDYFQKAFTKEDGSFDMDGYTGLIALHKNFSAFIEKVTNQVHSDLREKDIREKKNIKPAPEKHTTKTKATRKEAVMGAIRSMR